MKKSVLLLIGLAVIISISMGVNRSGKYPGSKGNIIASQINQQAKKDTASKVFYTCTMHPEVMKDKPGKCPKCGMILVKKEVTKDIYTCTMHPEVLQDKPGKCPKCGMDLVKKEPSKKEEPKI